VVEPATLGGWLMNIGISIGISPFYEDIVRIYIYYTNHMNPYDALGFSEIMGFILQQKAIAIRISSDFSGFHHDDDFLGCLTHT
jgi:hypothetical protein